MQGEHSGSGLTDGVATQVGLEAGLLGGVPFARAGPNVSGFTLDFYCQHAILADVDGGSRMAVHDDHADYLQGTVKGGLVLPYKGVLTADSPAV